MISLHHQRMMLFIFQLNMWIMTPNDDDKEKVQSEIKGLIPFKREPPAVMSSSSFIWKWCSLTIVVTLYQYLYINVQKAKGDNMYALTAAWILQLNLNFVIIMPPTQTFHLNAMFALLCFDQNNHTRTIVWPISRSHLSVLIVTKVFPLSSSLSNHMRTHTGVKDVCPMEEFGKSFHSRGKILEHVQYSHLNEKMAPCHMCRYLFQTPSKLHYHLSSVHLIFPKGAKPKQ